MDQTALSFNNASIATPIYNSKLKPKKDKEVVFKDYFSTTLAVGGQSSKKILQAVAIGTET